MSEDEIRDILENMQKNPALVTEPTFRASSDEWPDNIIPFIDNHISYLKRHPKIDPVNYLSNLKIMLRKN